MKIGQNVTLKSDTESGLWSIKMEPHGLGNSWLEVQQMDPTYKIMVTRSVSVSDVTPL